MRSWSDRQIEALSASFAAGLGRRQFLAKALMTTGAAAAWVAGLSRGAYALHNDTIYPNCLDLSYDGCPIGCGPSPLCGMEGTSTCCDNPDTLHCNIHNCTARKGQCPDYQSSSRCWKWKQTNGCGAANCTITTICCDCYTSSDQPCSCRQVNFSSGCPKGVIARVSVGELQSSS